MTKEEIIRNLKYTMEKHKNDKVNTFGTNISLMCKDVLDYLEQPTSDDCVSIAELEKWLDLNFSFGGACRKLELFDRLEKELPRVTPTQKWIPVSKRFPTKEEYIANNGLFIVTDGNRTYTEHFNMYAPTGYFGKPTINEFKVDKCVIAWQPLPQPYKEK